MASLFGDVPGGFEFGSLTRLSMENEYENELSMLIRIEIVVLPVSYLQLLASCVHLIMLHMQRAGCLHVHYILK